MVGGDVGDIRCGYSNNVKQDAFLLLNHDSL
jgi:hypothetical protein